MSNATLTRWRVIVSTISFGKRIEITSGFVWGDTEEIALRQSDEMGNRLLTHWKFERIERA
jgi:hypothetical protein